MAPDGIDPSLEQEYALRARYPERESIYARMRGASEDFRARQRGHVELAYGQSARERIDFFPGGRDAPLVVFIHGGYWRALDKETFLFLAAPLVAAGFSVAMPGYDLAPGISLAAIEAQIGEALGLLRHRAGELAFDPGRVVLSGHSAGGQLAAMAMLRGSSGLGVRGLFGVSGVYDLLPLVATSVGASIRLDPETAAAASPMRLAGLRAQVPARLAVGADETAGFRGQSHDFARARIEAGGQAIVDEIPGTNHFTVLDRLFEGDGLAWIAARLAAVG